MMTSTAEPNLSEGIYSVVSAFELEKRTREGWVLVRILQESEATTQFEQVPQPVAPGGYSSGATMSVQKALVVKVHKFLMRKDAASELAHLTTKAEELEKQLAEAKKNWEAENKTAKDLAAKLSTAEGNTTRLANERDECRRIAEANAEKVRRMEEDFAKVWQGVGEFTMKEILGAEAKNPRPPPPDQRRTVYERLTTNEET